MLTVSDNESEAADEFSKFFLKIPEETVLKVYGTQSSNASQRLWENETDSFNYLNNLTLEEAFFQHSIQRLISA